MSIERNFFLLFAIAGLILGLFLPLPSAGILLGAGVTRYFLLPRNESEDYEFKKTVELQCFVIRRKDADGEVFYGEEGGWKLYLGEAELFYDEGEAQKVISGFAGTDRYEVKMVSVLLDVVDVNIKLVE